MARFLFAIQRQRLPTDRAHLVEINGQPSILVRGENGIQGVMTFEIREGYIQSIYAVRNSEKLKQFNKDATHQSFV